jgi:hypothetical protein
MTREQKIETIKIIANSFAKCLVGPCNPFSIDNPDLIVARESNIYAVYIPNYYERSNYDHLLRRLQLSQLGYSIRFIPILLLDVDDKLSEIGWREMGCAFEHVSRSADDVVKYINAGDRFNRKWKEFNRVQQLHFLKYKAISKISLQFRKDINPVYSKFEIAGSNTFAVNHWSNRNSIWRLNNVYNTQFGIIGFNEKGKNYFQNSFQNLMTASFMSGYTYDNGYIYQKKELNHTINVANTDWNLL